MPLKISKVIMGDKMEYVGHMSRQEETWRMRLALMWEVAGKRKRGQRKETLKRTLLTEAGMIGMQWIQAVMIATQDR